MSRIYAAIAGTGHYAPAARMSNDDVAMLVDTSDDWIRERTGIRARHVAAPGERNSDMGIAAAKMAVANAGIDPSDIDAIFYATCSGDMVFPATACFVQHAIGATRAYGYDISSACTGFLMALDTATAAIESGRIQTALVIGAEKLSAFTDWSDRNTCVLFGDGAGAAVLRASDTPGVLSSLLGVDGAQADILSIPSSGSLRPPSEATIRSHQIYIHMAGRETFKTAVNTMVNAARNAVAKAGLSLDDIDCMIPHQANMRIVEAVAKRLGPGVLERAFLNLDEYGNTSAASIPLALSEAVQSGRVKRGDKILMVAFGGGLSWGGAVVQL